MICIFCQIFSFLQTWQKSLWGKVSREFFLNMDKIPLYVLTFGSPQQISEYPFNKEQNLFIIINHKLYKNMLDPSKAMI